MSILESVKTTLGIGIAGELAAVQEEIRNCKPVYSPIVNEKIRWAEKIIKDLEFDRQNRSDQLGFEEKQINQKLFEEASVIVKAKLQAEDVCTARQKELQEKKRLIEQAIAKWKARKAYLIEVYKTAEDVGYDAKRSRLENDIKHLRYTLDRDRKSLLFDFGEFDVESATLQEKKAAAEGFDIIEIELQIKEVEMKRQSFMTNVYPRFKKDFEDRKKRIEELERQNKELVNGYREDLEQCDSELTRLIGRCD